MKYDYLRNQKQKPRKQWWQDKNDKAAKRQIINQIVDHPIIYGANFEALQLSENDLYKHTIIEEMPFSMNDYLNDEIINLENSSSLIFYYPTQSKESTKIYYTK